MVVKEEAIPLVTERAIVGARMAHAQTRPPRRQLAEWCATKSGEEATSAK